MRQILEGVLLSIVRECSNILLNSFISVNNLAIYYLFIVLFS